jgi:CRISPR/Cas system-associated protein Cas7 (RAMP superfamily)
MIRELPDDVAGFMRLNVYGRSSNGHEIAGNQSVGIAKGLKTGMSKMSRRYNSGFLFGRPTE